MRMLAVEPTVGGLLAAGAASLEEAGLPSPRQDAEWLLADALGADRLGLVLGLDRVVPAEPAGRFRERIARRMAHEPLQYILGYEEWRGLLLLTGPAALIPRPETELLVEWALELERRWGPWGLAVDVGTGNGAIACALARGIEHLQVLAVERSRAALALAASNIAALGLVSRVAIVAGDLLEPVASVAGTVDLVISNPPYIASGAISGLPPEVREWEPRDALDGGRDGMTVHRQLIARAPRVLKPGGWLLMEMGEGQAALLSASMEAAGFEAVKVRKDLPGIDRMIAGRRARR